MSWLLNIHTIRTEGQTEDWHTALVSLGGVATNNKKQVFQIKNNCWKYIFYKVNHFASEI